jgi:hypothetical protein
VRYYEILRGTAMGFGCERQARKAIDFVYLIILTSIILILMNSGNTVSLLSLILRKSNINVQPYRISLRVTAGSHFAHFYGSSKDHRLGSRPLKDTFTRVLPYKLPQ